MGELKHNIIEAEFCVVGGGMAGMLAAISAARHGVKTVLMHDRPVLGGNASSEIRMWISGAGTRVPYLQETGIMEEIALKTCIAIHPATTRRGTRCFMKKSASNRTSPFSSTVHAVKRKWTATKSRKSLVSN